MTDWKDPHSWLEHLIDSGSWVALGAGAGAAGPEVWTGFARVNGRDVAICAHDPRVDKGYITSKGARKIRRLMDRAKQVGIPLISLLASPGVSVTEGMKSGEEYSAVLMGHCELSGVIPQIALVMGPNIGGPAYSATLNDVCLFNRLRSYLCVSGPGVVKSVLHEDSTFEVLGGAALHARTTGVAHFVDERMEDMLRRARWLVGFFPPNNAEDPGIIDEAAPTEPLPKIPENPRALFDMKLLIRGITDASQFVEYGAEYGPSCLTGWARLGGYPVGIIANQSTVNGGVIDSKSAHKIARFTRLSDAYNIPLLTLIDSPGFMPGVAEESAGILKEGALLCHAMMTKVPKLSVAVRKCYGAAAIVLGQTQKWRGDLALALPQSRLSVMGFEAADQAFSVDGSGLDRGEYFEKYESIDIGNREGVVDQMVELAELRPTLIAHLGLLRNQRDHERPATREVFP